MKKFLLAALILAGSVGAHAEGLYVGVAAGGSHFNLGCDSATRCDRTGSGFKLLGGYQLTDNVAVEAHYADYGKTQGKLGGKFNGSDISVDAKLSGYGIGVALLGDFSRDWNGVVRAGIASNKLKTGASAGGVSLPAYGSETRTKAYAGAGVGYKLTRDVALTAAIDYTQGQFMGEKVTAALYTIGVNYSF